VWILDPAGGGTVRTLGQYKESAGPIAWSLDGSRRAGTGAVGTVTIWDPAAGGTMGTMGTMWIFLLSGWR
jgi:hypothetical protein